MSGPYRSPLERRQRVKIVCLCKIHQSIQKNEYKVTPVVQECNLAQRVTDSDDSNQVAHVIKCIFMKVRLSLGGHNSCF